MASTTRKSFSVKEKIKIIQEYDCTKLNQRDFAASKNISASTLRTILKRRTEIFNVSDGTERKKMRSAKFEKLEKILKEWFTQARSSNIPVSGPILQEKAQKIAEGLGISDFNASSGWLDRFKNRHSIIYRKICGESKAVDPTSTLQWKEGISALTEGYNPSEIYNADEFGLFFKLMPDKSLVYKMEKCHGGKLSKERLTVLVCTNSSGLDKRKPVVIGKYATPRCLRNVKSLPCVYTSQSRAWMTADYFSKWLHQWDNELEQQKRNILLLVDNCAAHPKIVNLRRIKLTFLPPNTTSELQPLDQGVIKVLKQGYRRRMVQYYLQEIENGANPKVTILDAIHFLHAAWKDVKPQTVSNCFKKAGYIEDEATDSQAPEEEIEEGWRSLVNNEIVPDLNSFLHVDDDLVTNEVSSVESLVQSHLSKENEENDEEEDMDEPAILPKSGDVIRALKTVRTYFTCSKNIEEDIFEKINSLETSVFRTCLSSKKQTKIDDFFQGTSSK